MVKARDEEFRKKTRFVIKLGKVLHDCGATSQRVERHLTNVTHLLGLEGSFLVSPTTFTCAFWEDDELDQFIHIERIYPSDNNLGRLWEVDQLVENIAGGQTSFEVGTAELDRLSQSPANYNVATDAFSWVLIGASFAALLSRNASDVWSAAGLSLLIFLIAQIGGRQPRFQPVLSILSPFVSGIAATGIASFGLNLNVPFVILSSIIVYIPGLALTVALSEIASRDLISGSSRLVDALMLLLKIFFGAVLGMKVAQLFWEIPAVPADLPATLPDWKTWPAVMGLSLGLNFAFNIPWRKAGWGLVSAAIAFGVAEAGASRFDMIGGVFLGALAVGLYSNLFARLTKAPASVLVTQGIVLLVPGSKTYMILNSWISGRDILPGVSGFQQALMIFVALVVGLLFANALLPANKSL